MQSDRRQFIAAAVLAVGASPLSVGAQDKPDEDARIVVLRGRVACLTEELERLYRVISDCATRGHVWALKASDGKFHPFLPVDTAAAVWLDERYRTRELQVTARSFPQGAFIEVIKLQSVKAGQVYDLDYFCDVCNISTHKPGPCDCCQDPVVFREIPTAQ